jgi:DNA-binding IclR family transcriptional regulator
MRNHESSTPDRSVVGRAFRLPDAFAADTPRLSMSDLSRRTGISLATAHRPCVQLVERRVLERDVGGGFTIGVRIWELGTAAPRAYGLRQAALPHLVNFERHLQTSVAKGSSSVANIWTGDLSRLLRRH